MIENGDYCIDIINQSSAVRNALSSLEDVVLENHLEEHVAQQMRGTERKRAISEVIGVFKKSKKK
jgi:DNA-binding FrmR family transcriptional regulator